MKKRSNKNLIIIASILCFATIILSTTIGIADISFTQTIKILLSKIFHINFKLGNIKESTVAIVWIIRFPRVMLAFFVGGALAICGVSYQGIFKNPMADPFILGVSSGAALGATIGIITNLDFYFLGINSISIFAFIGAIASLFIVYNISKVGRKVPMATLLLSGIAIGQFLSAAISLCMVFSNDFQSIFFWTMGSFNAKSWNQLIMVFPYVTIGFIIIYSSNREMDIMLLGEDTASQLGVDTEKLKMKILITTAFVTAAAVSVTGIIGFVGLIIPHIVRIITGPKHKVLLPYSFVAGGLFMIVCDTIARSFMSQEIPVGIITALFGGPFFVYLLKKRMGRGI
jgi:iron complex transport system permease protein